MAKINLTAVAAGIAAGLVSGLVKQAGKSYALRTPEGCD